MNMVFLTGRLTKAPELRYTANNTAVAKFTVATNEGKDRSGKELTQFVFCEAWEKDAENISRFFDKGAPIILTGRVIAQKYEKDGETRFSQSVRVIRWEFPQAKDRVVDARDAEPSSSGGFEEIDGADGDLPF